MGRKKKSKIIRVKEFSIKTLRIYIHLLVSSFFHPKEFSKVISKKKTFFPSLVFILVNITLWISLTTLITLYPFRTHATFSFVFVDSLIKTSLLLFIIFFYSIFTFVLSKLLKGTGNFFTNLRNIFYVSPPLIFFGIKFLQPLLFIWMIYLLILISQKSQRYTLLSAVVNILIPAVFISLILSAVGLFPKILPFDF